MKETKKVEEYSITSKSSMDDDVRWLYELFGWQYVKTTDHENKYVEKKDYLVSEGEGRYRIESGYKSAGSSHDVTHHLERDMEDPKYDRYCALERRMGTFDRYGCGSAKDFLKSVCPKGVPKRLSSYKYRYIKYYVIGAILLLAMGMPILVNGPQLLTELELTELAASEMEGFSSFALGIGLGAISILYGAFVHIKTLIKSVLARDYLKYVGKRLSKEASPRRCSIIEEAIKLQLED